VLEADPRPGLLRKVTGLEPVPQHDRHVVTASAIASVERIHLADVGSDVVVAFWPAELKDQATYLYQGARATAMVATGRSNGWSVEARPQLAFRNSAPRLRLYLQPVVADTAVDEYVRRWSGADRGWIGAHSASAVRSDLWPWLKKAGYATDADDPALRQYLDILGRRDAFFRAALAFTQRWSGRGPEGDLVERIRAAINAPLAAAGEACLPLKPA
jgi:hypothetical protein